MTKAIWNDEVLAESDACRVVEGHSYFPPESVRKEFLRPTRHHSHCRRKGTASYYDVVVDGKVNCKAAWSYPDPKEGARQLQGCFAFWHGVKIL